MSEIPKRPEKWKSGIDRYSLLADHEHAVAKALWEAVKFHPCHTPKVCKRGAPYTCNRCTTLEEVKASGWKP
jgi:hypothetical protein